MKSLQKAIDSVLFSTLAIGDVEPVGLPMWRGRTRDAIAKVLWNLEPSDYDAEVRDILLKMRQKVMADRGTSFDELLRLGHKLCAAVAPERIPFYEHILGA